MSDLYLDGSLRVQRDTDLTPWRWVFTAALIAVATVAVDVLVFGAVW